MRPFLRTLGLMSGTALDAIDIAYLETDGEEIQHILPGTPLPIPPTLQESLRACMQGDGRFLETEEVFTRLNASAVHQFLAEHHLSTEDIDLIGFHGQTILYHPKQHQLLQMGNGSLLAALTGIDTVTDFRRLAMAMGGHGAPLVPVFHEAITRHLPRPLALVNIGGVANITWIGKQGELIACDTGPGNALINDQCLKHFGKTFDEDGAIAAQGTPDTALVNKWLQDPYFQQPSPKSLDRNYFSQRAEALEGAPTDILATLTYFTAAAIVAICNHLPAIPAAWFLCGGGTHNRTLIRYLQQLLPSSTWESAATIGLDVDGLEAQAFAFLAARSIYNLPITLPSTTGVKEPCSGGGLYRAPAKSGDFKGQWEAPSPLGRRVG